MLHDPNKIILICRFGAAQATFLSSFYSSSYY